MARFFDIDLMEPMNDIFTEKGLVYCSKNGEFVCTLENNSKLVIRRVENGEWLGDVDFDVYDIGHVYLSTKYAVITLRKASSPLIIDLCACKLITVMSYQTSFCCISSDDKVLLVHSQKLLHYHSLPDLKRLISIEYKEIPELVVFDKKNTRIFVVSKNTKELICFSLILEKKICKEKSIFQDSSIIDIKIASNDQTLLVCCLYCIYVVDLKNDEFKISFQFDSTSIEKAFKLTSTPRTASTSSASSLSTNGSNFNNRNVFTGFGFTLNCQIIYATFYTNLICFDASTGKIKRIFQATLAANRILKSFSSYISDTIVSLLDDGTVLVWNLENIDIQLKFEDMKMFSDQVSDCLLPQTPFDSVNNSKIAISYTKVSPDLHVHNLEDGFTLKSLLKTHYNEEKDDPLTITVKLIVSDDNLSYICIVYDVEDFVGKNNDHESDFIKRVCSIINTNSEEYKVIETFSYLIKNESRFEIKAQFFTKSTGNVKETFLLIHTISCINDFDAFNKLPLDWTDFETNVQVYGPFKEIARRGITEKLTLFDEFQIKGECLQEDFIITKDYYYAALMQECNKLYDKLEPSKIKAKSYSISLKIYEPFENKTPKSPVQIFDLNEFLDIDSYSEGNTYLDMREINNGHLLLVYSKEGALSSEAKAKNKNPFRKIITTFEYDYKRFRFNRDIKTNKGAIIYNPVNNQVVKHYSSFLNDLSNVERLVCSNNYIVDHFFNIFNLRDGKIFKKINITSTLLDFTWTRFMLDARYLICVSIDKTKVFIIRCYDSCIVSSFRINDVISCLRLGESDRTLILGTINGNVLGFKLLIDLEFNEAISTFSGNYRLNKKKKSDDEQISITIPKSNQQLRVYSVRSKVTNDQSNIDNDRKRLSYSAHAHRLLKARETYSSMDTSSQFTSSSMSMYNNSIETFNGSSYHSGIAKYHLYNITTGIKHSNLRNTSTRACIIS
jgi:hypothetical protein